jgi:hypothetical protein
MNNRHLFAVLAGALAMSGAGLVVGRGSARPKQEPPETPDVEYENRQQRRAAEKRARKFAKQAKRRMS